MTSRHSRLAFALLIFSAGIVLMSARIARAAVDVCAAPVVITLAVAPANDGTCTQALPLVNPSNLAIFVNTGQCVQFTAGAHKIAVLFDQGSSPFYLFAAPANQTVTTGPMNGQKGDTYYYRSVAIDDVYCLNGKSLGIVMR